MTEKMTVWTAHRTGRMTLPPGYTLEHGADVLLLRRGDGSVVAVFSATGATPAEVTRVAEEDHKRRAVWVVSRAM
jgi:hypothetical protein